MPTSWPGCWPGRTNGSGRKPSLSWPRVVRTRCRCFQGCSSRIQTSSPRVHALWALGQVAGGSRNNVKAALRGVAKALKDPDAEIRAQAAKVLGDARFGPARSDLTTMTASGETSRERFYAAMALGKLGGTAAARAVLEMARQNDDRDPYLRHAAVMALYGIKDRTVLRQAGQDKSAAIRLAALLALRKFESPEIAKFLEDSDPRIVLEAARAINDLPIQDALPKLADLIRRPTDSAPLFRRIVNAHFRLGGVDSAVALAKVAANESASEAYRLEALWALGEWEKPSGRDLVTGLWRTVPARPGSQAPNAIRPILSKLLTDRSDEIKGAAARLAAKYRLNSPGLAALVKNNSASSSSRVEALRALEVLNDPQLSELLKDAMASKDQGLAIEAIGVMAKRDPAKATELLAGKLENGSMAEKQGSLRALGGIRHPSAEPILARKLDELLTQKLEPALQIELLEAANNRPDAAIKKKVERFDRSRPQNEVGKYVETLFGGNAQNGQKIFFEKVEASCSRCHKVKGVGGNVGPDLAMTLTNRSREYLLESIVAPSKTIAPGYESVTVVLKSGVSFAGTVRSETETELVLDSPEDGLTTIKKADIESRKTGLSGMQPNLSENLSKRELRDLIEFLATLR